ncbi:MULTISPECIES: cytochrome P450 [unclassified Rhizobium]|uniref:cytochrome P450 n=1 Tax=unclassified Rhizobium TaxID=2613769 RepID=UPI00119DFBF3|nr:MULTISPECIES: cytochrome P450 [unclassified Rhizobium]
MPAGTVLIVPIYAVYHQTSLWSDREAFNSDRFTPEAAKAGHRYACMPFGAGPRVCVGNAFAVMEAVAIFAVLLQKVRLGAIAPQPPKPIMKVHCGPIERCS